MTDTPQPIHWKDWKIYHFDEIDSTNEQARNHSPWTVIVAQTQTAGRGRHGRRWTSDSGGLWCSVVLPTPGNIDRWELLPLVVGLSVIRTLKALDISARMRWPNDVLVDDKKLAGLLLERHRKEHVIAGIGINLFNNPDSSDKTLRGTTIRLADVTPSPPSLDDFLCRILAHVKEAHRELLESGPAKIFRELNQMWGELPTQVELFINDARLIGEFLGITESGHLRFRSNSESEECFPPSKILRLVELDQKS
ncbi:MAG: biotin--[acetyl-CoA-carboxylase] ligase [Verrucomicrobiota bacterium]